ncbi:MAG: hypothetical protein PF495_07460, partial [Spirochaetales bacterium]|nr:hypothetical protein [Spirochaetales bacterium]
HVIVGVEIEFHWLLLWALGPPYSGFNALSKADKRQHNQDDNDQSNDVNDASHNETSSYWVIESWLQPDSRVLIPTLLALPRLVCTLAYTGGRIPPDRGKPPPG